MIYVAHDQDYSEPILRDFESATGIRVKPLYDTELTKTVGLVNKLLAEKSNPQADVFWNNEVSRSILLKKEGMFEPYCSPNAEDVPAEFKDPGCHWTGFAARARVIIYNTDLVSEPPDSVLDFIDPEWNGKICMANPLFGTTGSHVAALFALWGDEEAKKFLTDMKDNGLTIVQSNSMVRDQVVAGEFLAGLTDTDDANDAIVEGKHVKMVFPDQDGIGTLIIPNSVGLVRNCPHPDSGRKLVDYLLSRDIERRLAGTKAMQMPLKDGVQTPPGVPSVNELRSMRVTDEQIFEKLDASMEFTQSVFIE